MDLSSRSEHELGRGAGLEISPCYLQSSKIRTALEYRCYEMPWKQLGSYNMSPKAKCGGAVSMAFRYWAHRCLPSVSWCRPPLYGLLFASQFLHQGSLQGPFCNALETCNHKILASSLPGKMPPLPPYCPLWTGCNLHNGLYEANGHYAENLQGKFVWHHELT